MRPLEVLGVVAEYTDGSKAAVAFGYRGGTTDGKNLLRYQVDMDHPLTIDAVDAERNRLQVAADATDAVNAHYMPSLVVPALTLVN